AAGFCHSTVWKVLKRGGISRPPRAARDPANRYEWPCPGDDRRRPLATRLRRDPRRPASHDRRRLLLPSAHLLRQPRHQREAADDRYRLAVRTKPGSTTTARPTPDPAPEDPALPPAHERESGALPPDHAARVGLRAPLPLAPRTSQRPATLAQPLQHAQTTQLTRRRAPDQPHSQRLWAGHLEGWMEPPPGPRAQDRRARARSRSRTSRSGRDARRRSSRQ